MNIFQKYIRCALQRKSMVWIPLVLVCFGAQSVFAGPSPDPIRINQLGYYPNSIKYAFIETDVPLEDILGAGSFYFAVIDNAIGAVKEHYTSPILDAKKLANFEGGGCDTPCKNSRTGTYLYQWDFSPLQTERTDFKVAIRKTSTVVGVPPSSKMSSPTFTIGNAAIRQKYYDMANSAFKYYYFHRIGETTTTDYLTTAEGFSAAHAHAGFHVDANGKPEGVPCFKDWCGNGVMGEANDIKIGAGTAWGDAGDYGVYPVNNAMAAWQMLNLVEFPTQSWLVSANIPQNATGWYQKTDPIEDSGPLRTYKIVTEVEVGSQFMKDFSKLPGLYPHKIHNQSWGEGFAAWTPQIEIDVVPAKDGDSGGGKTDYKKRSATQPSTASTLAVCRTAFHLARVMKTFGKDTQANEWLSIGLRAWGRSHNTNVLYPSAYATNAEDKLSIGGGPYGDSDISDDFYACFVEAYLAYYVINKNHGNFTAARSNIMGSSHYKLIDRNFDWQKVRTQANLSLLVAANDLPAADIETIKRNVSSKANEIMDFVMANESDGWSDDGKPAVSFADYGNASGSYLSQWGSNPTLLNMGVLATYAAVFPRQNPSHTPAEYAKAALKTMDYILGENAQNISFVTGYGKYAEEDTHDRMAWWAKNIHSSKAKYPKGWLSGGPMGNWASCLAGDETKWNGDRSYETGSIFWTDTTGKPYTLDDAWNDGFINSAGITKDGDVLTAEMSNKVLNGQAPSTTYYPIQRGTTIPSLKVYGAIGTSADAWCTKENTVNYNSALLWMSTAAGKALRWQID